MVTTMKTSNLSRDHAYTRSPRMPHPISYTKTIFAKCNLTNHQAAQARPSLVALPSALACLLLSFLPGRAIPSLLGVSYTARWLCACMYEVDLSLCWEQNDVRFVSSLVRLRTLDLSYYFWLSSVAPLSPLTSLRSLNLCGCCYLSTSVVPHLLDQLEPVCMSSVERFITSVVPHLLDQLEPEFMWGAVGRLTFVVHHLFDQLESILVLSVVRCVTSVVPHLLDQLKPV